MPALAGAHGGAVVRLSGSYFDDVQRRPGVGLGCKFGTQVVSAWFVSAHVVECRAPARAEGFVRVELTVNNETSAELNAPDETGVQYCAPAVVTSVTPAWGAAGTVLTVTGANIQLGVACRFGKLAVSGAFVSSTLVRCEVPHGLPPGVTPFTLTNPGDVLGVYDATAAWTDFTVLDAVQLHALAPRSGPSTGGTVARVHASGLSTWPPDARCRFGTVVVRALPGDATDAHLSCVSPAMEPRFAGRAFDLTSGCMAVASHSQLTYWHTPQPLVSGAEPDVASGSGGSSVTLYTDPEPWFSAASCLMGTRLLPSPAHLAGRAVHCVLPPATPGFVVLRLVSDAPDYFSSDGVDVQIVPQARVLGATPALVPPWGGEVLQIVGMHFAVGITCHYDDEAGHLALAGRWVSSVLVLCEQPPLRVGVVAVDVVRDGAARIEIVSDEPPVAADAQPRTAVEEGGTQVLLFGVLWPDAATMECAFGTVWPVVGARASTTECLCIAPAHAPSTVPLQLSRPVLRQPYVTLAIVYDVAPTLFAMQQESSGAVAVLGAGFPLSERVSCNLCGAQVAGVVRNERTIVCSAPGWLGDTFSVRITLATNDILLQAPESVEFAFFETAPTLLRAQPTTAWTQGGSLVALHGSELKANTRCAFGDASPVRSVFVSTALVVCESPVHAAGPSDVFASGAPGQWSQPLSSLSFEPLPLLKTAQPMQGATTGATVVVSQVDGLNGDGDLFCAFGPIAFVHATLLSSSAAACISPARAPGYASFMLTVVGGAASGGVHSLRYLSFDPPVFDVVSPDFALVAAMSVVRLDWDVLVPGGVACGTSQGAVSPGRLTQDSSFCEVSPGDAGFIIVDLTFEGNSGSAQFQLLALNQPRVASLQPDCVTEAGGTLVAVQGSGLLLHGMRCLFDAESSAPAAVLSSALAVCEVPAHVPDDSRTLHLVASFSHHVDAGLAFQTAPAVGIVLLKPGVACSEGGALVHAAVDGPSAGVHSCKFGTIFPVSAAVDQIGVRCIAPAHTTGVVPAALSCNGRDWREGSTAAVLTYVQQPVLLDIDPSEGWADGDTEVLLHVDGLHAGADIEFLFDAAACSSIKSSSTAVLCSTPAHAPGFASVLLLVDGGLADVAGFSFAYRAQANIVSLLPAHGPASGGSMVAITGTNLQQEGSACIFGADGLTRVPAQFESSVLMRCQAPARWPGRENVEADALAARAGGGNTRQPPYFEFFADATVLSLQPRRGSTSGGTLVATTSTTTQTHCRFGSTAPVAGSEQTSMMLACVSPAHVSGLASFFLTANLATWTPSADGFEFVPAPAANAVAVPDTSSTPGDSIVTLLVEEPIVNGLGWRCVFGTVAVPAQLSVGCGKELPSFDARSGDAGRFVESCRGSVFTCISPAHFAGSVSLQLDNDVLTYAVESQFLFLTQSSAAAVFPAAGPAGGGTVVTVVGAHFVAQSDLACRFDGARSVGSTVVSSAVLRCESPPRPVGPASLVVLPMSRAPLAFVFYSASVTGVTPASGPESGGTTVEFAGSGFTDSPALACRFGSTFPVAARFQTAFLLQCVSPALYPEAAATIQLPRATAVYVSMNMADGVSAPVPFEYQPGVRVRAVTPGSGIHLGQTPVFVIGAGFVNTTGLSCRFGVISVPATYLSYANLLCLAPAQAAGAVFLEVSNNGEDFTTDRSIFFYGTCRTGYYCPAGEPLPCPRGAFCAGTANFNFTLCPPGTYQPQTAQPGCLPAPVGYISPDFGTVFPRLCPRGSVCDVMGLSGATLPCPPGHYCLEGTRTANFTDFRVAERPLPCPFGFYCGPGVSANKSIANNFTTPQPCYAGYLCEPGSVTPQGSGPCPAGHYCRPGQLIPCPPRTYCPNVANTEPKPCLPGTYNEQYGLSTCKQCPRGTVCPGFARELPQLCPPGYVCDQVGLPLPTARCPAGHFCLSNTVTVDPLAPLDEVQLQRASPIALNVSNFRPQPCFPGTYCLEGVGNSTTAEGIYFNPQPCNPGSYCEWGTSDRTVQGGAGATDISNAKLPCPAGSYCPTGTYIPIPAPRGSFASGTGNAQAALCLPGTYTHYEGFQRCLACPAGYECRKDGTYKPVICDAGKYRSSRDSITCVSCPVGTWSPFKGLTDEALCLPCNSGLVCGVDGMTNNKPYGDSVAKVLNGQLSACEKTPPDPDCSKVTLQPLGQAALCPEGYVCDARTSIAADKCPDGYFCGYGTTPETQFANPCPAGYFCPAGTTASGRYQFPCLVCFYCPQGTGLILPRCPEGTQSVANAQSLDNCTADQITFWRVQPLKFALVNRTAALARGTSANTTVGSNTSTLSGGTSNSSSAAGLDTAVNATNATTTSVLADVYNAFGRCNPTNFDALKPSFVVDTVTFVTVPDVEGVPLVYFQVPRNYIAKLQFDFRNISSELVYGQHYEVAIFMGDYSTQTMCTPSDYQAVPCPPWDPGDGINKATMGVLTDRLNEVKCPRSTNGLEMPFWFARNGLYGQPATNNVAEPDPGTFVDKKGLMELNILGNDDVQFRVEIRMLHGRYQAANRRSFLDTMCIDLVGPQRGSSLPNASFHIVYPRNDGYELPMNLPLRSPLQRSVPLSYMTCIPSQLDPTCRLLQPELTLSFNSSYASEFMLANRYWQQELAAGAAATSAANSTRSNSTSANGTSTNASNTAAVATSYSDYLTTVPDVITLEANVLRDSSEYWSNGDEFVAMDYIPFFSACRGFDAQVVLYQVLQTGWTAEDVDGRYSVAYGEGCTLVPEEDTKFINQWAPQVFTPVADTCTLQFTCLFQESYASAAALPRWFEASGDTLLYLTKEPQPRERLFEASAVATDQSTPAKDMSFYAQAMIADGLMAVNFGPAVGSPAAGTVPKLVTLSLTYFPYSRRDKRLITADVTFDMYQSASTHDGTYTLAIELTPMGWFDLLNAFAFDTLFYTALFLAIGLLADLLLYVFWGFCRVFTRLRDPPRFKSWALLSLMVEPQVSGLVLAMIPFYCAELGIQKLMQIVPLVSPFLSTFPANVDTLGVSLADASTVNGRFGVFFLVIALHGLYTNSQVLIPDRAKSDTDGLLDADGDEEDAGAGMDPVHWQRTHYVAGALLMTVPDLFLAEFSTGNTYGAYLYPCWWAMKMYHMMLQSIMKQFIVDDLLFGSIVGINEAMETVTTIAASTFTDFALAYYLDILYACIEDLFLGTFIGLVESNVPKLVFQLEKLYYRVRKRTLTEHLLHAAQEDEESEVESLMGFICDYGPATTGLVIIPFILYFIWDFNDQLTYTSLWNVTRPDLLLYVLFVTVMIPFQWITDMFRFNAQESFQGWKVYEYLKYARYRFRNRTARWKGLETQFDESIAPSLRTSDQMCFSNQWYFTLGLGASSGTLFVLAVQMLLRANYNPFGDVLLLLIIVMALALCVLGRKAAIALANLLNLWRIRDAGDLDDALFMDEDEPLPSSTAQAHDTAHLDGTGRLMTIDDLTTADITSDAFRRKFLDANRLWLVDQLGERVSPRTLRRMRAAALSSDDDSDVVSAAGTDHEAPALSEASAFIMRQWASTARARVPGRLGRTLPVLSTDDEEDDTRFPPVTLTPNAKSVLSGWLAASRASKAMTPAVPVAGTLSSSGSDSGSSHQRFPPMQPGVPARLVAGSWLHAARHHRVAASQQHQALPVPDALSDTSASGNTSSDSSERAFAPAAAVGARARAVALTWLSLVRIRRAVHRVDL